MKPSLFRGKGPTISYRTGYCSLHDACSARYRVRDDLLGFGERVPLTCAQGHVKQKSRRLNMMGQVVETGTSTTRAPPPSESYIAYHMSSVS